LRKEELKTIHYYFGAIRRNKMIEHFRIQFALGIAVPVLMLLYHFSKRGMPGSWQTDEMFKFLPYASALIGGVLVWVLRRRHDSSYQRLLLKSPGRDLD